MRKYEGICFLDLHRNRLLAVYGVQVGEQLESQERLQTAELANLTACLTASEAIDTTHFYNEADVIVIRQRKQRPTSAVAWSRQYSGVILIAD